MKKIFIGLLTLSVMFAFACNKKPGKKADTGFDTTIKPRDQRQVIEKPDYVEHPEFKVCDSIAKEILTTSPRYKRLTKGLGKAVAKNGGLSVGLRLEGSPYPTKDNSLIYSETYDFTVYEIYTDRELNTARFSFNPENEQLYEYDEVDNQLKPIEFDRSILITYDSICK